MNIEQEWYTPLIKPICKLIKHKWQFVILSLEGEKVFKCSRCKTVIAIKQK
ncbi:DUF1660 family phage protein [Methylophaga sp.]|uniref:DUF1660 family phage protein n=1 Tax=Methylophaga sp. TaxID=2024840 RepID=UPI003A9224E4